MAAAAVVAATEAMVKDSGAAPKDMEDGISLKVLAAGRGETKEVAAVTGVIHVSTKKPT